MPDDLQRPQLQMLLDVAPDAFVVTRQDGEILLVNAQTEALFGYDRTELVGQPVERLLPERFRTQHRSHRAAFHTAPRHRTMGEGLDLFGLRQDGTEFAVDISLGPIAIGGDTLVVAAIRDVTERKRLEAAARRLEHETLRQRQALELNDGVVQGLAAAQMALERDATADAARILDDTLASARAIISELLTDLESGDLQPGDLVRSRPALIERD